MENNEEKKKDLQSKKKLLDNYVKYSGLALQLVVMILAGVWAGVKLDEKFPGLDPLFKLVFSLGSVAFSMYYLIRQLSRIK